MTRRLVQALVGLAVGGLAIAFYSYWYVERATPFSNIAIGMAGICMGLFGLWATRDFPYTRFGLGVRLRMGGMPIFAGLMLIMVGLGAIGPAMVFLFAMMACTLIGWILRGSPPADPAPGDPASNAG